MYPSLTTFPGDILADIERQLDRALGSGDWPSSIRAVARRSFPAINMGVTDASVEIYAFAPGLDPAVFIVGANRVGCGRSPRGVSASIGINTNSGPTRVEVVAQAVS